ncbi:hypothetical protein C3731_20150 [Brucella oryzae]|uniref:Uncharacterized protein n=1 Tax=Brucella oryzae TaxID=335286 RepID=A0A2S7IUW4_9HYPH|nr:hypothetical protein C3731_20150 [Brucella oryzae]
MKDQAQRCAITRNSIFTLQDWLNACSIRAGEFVNVHRVYVLVLFKMQPSDTKKPCVRHKFQRFFDRFLC